MSIVNVIALSAAGDDNYRIERSLRFNSPDTAYLNRTPAIAGNRRTWTWSGWVKRSALGTTQRLFNAYSGDENNTTEVGFDPSDRIVFSEVISGTQGNGFYGITSAVFRDVSAWYHIVYAVDTTQSTAAAALKVYVNGVQQTLGTSSYGGGANHNTFVNNTNVHRIGQTAPPNSGYFDGYLTEVNFIDGQALTPSSFGETNPVTGVWGPKRYAGTYGTNGFYLKFADNSNTTAATLGKDSSGNGNNWTPNNFSVTAGVGNDSFIDVPTPYADGGNGRGNYPTWNPLNAVQSQLVEGNLWSQATGSSTNVVTTFPTPRTGKWYAEIPLGVSPNINWPMNMGISDGIGGNTFCRLYTDWSAFAIFKSLNGTTSNVTPSGSFPANSDILKIAYDADNGRIWLGLNANWYGNSGSLTGNPSTGTDPTLSGATAKEMYPNHCNAGGPAQQAYLNCGQRPFAYTPPTDFLALNTQNLPEPSIKKPSSYMDAKLYTGTGASRSITGLGFSPDLVWTKARSSAESHRIYDTARGATLSLFSNLTSAQSTESQSLTAFNSDGFTLGTGAPNTSSVTYIAWCWDESATPGFDIVTYTGNGTNRTIAHSLGVAPKFIITKSRTTADDWFCYHDAIGNTKYILLDSTAASTTSSTIWNNTSPTSSTFSLGTSGGANRNVDNFVAYCFSEVAGFSKFGSYTGNGSADGPFVHCGFRPRWVMFKRSDSTGSWFLEDSARGTYNVMGPELYANLSDAETTVSRLDFLSNGFKMRAGNAGDNASGGTYIFAAFAESPFKYSLAR